jgi:hypothetical protein
MFRYLAILPLMFLSGACGTKTQTDIITSSQWELFHYLPCNTEYLLYADLNEIRKAKYGEDNFISSLPEKPSGAWLRKFEKETGTGVRKGIREVIIANTPEDESIILVNFDRNYDRVKKYFKDNTDFGSTDHADEFIVVKKPDTRVYLPGRSILVVSNNEDYIDSLRQGRSATLKANKNFISIIKNIKEKHTLWMATDKGAFAAGIFDRLAGKDSKLLSPEILSSINNFTISAEFNEGTVIESVLGCSTAGNAYLLASAVQGAIAMNILSQKNYRLGKLLEKMDVNREGNLIRFNLNLTYDELLDIQQLTKLENQGIKSKGKLWQ